MKEKDESKKKKLFSEILYGYIKITTTTIISFVNKKRALFIR